MDQWFAHPVYRWQRRRLARGGRAHLQRVTVMSLILALAAWFTQLAPLTSPQSFHNLLGLTQVFLIFWAVVVTPIHATFACQRFFRSEMGLIALSTPLSPRSIIFALLAAVAADTLAIMLLPMPLIAIFAYYIEVDFRLLLLFLVGTWLLAIQAACFSLCRWLRSLSHSDATLFDLYFLWYIFLIVSCFVPFLSPIYFVSTTFGDPRNNTNHLITSLLALPGPLGTLLVLTMMIRRYQDDVYRIAISPHNKPTASPRRRRQTAWYEHAGDAVEGIYQITGPFGFLARIVVDALRVIVIVILIGLATGFAFAMFVALVTGFIWYWLLALIWFGVWIAVIWVGLMHPRLTSPSTWQLLLTTPISASVYQERATEKLHAYLNPLFFTVCFANLLGLPFAIVAMIIVAVIGMAYSLLLLELCLAAALTGARRELLISLMYLGLGSLCILPLMVHFVPSLAIFVGLSVSAIAGVVSLIRARWFSDADRPSPTCIVSGILGLAMLIILSPLYYYVLSGHWSTLPVGYASPMLCMFGVLGNDQHAYYFAICHTLGPIFLIYFLLQWQQFDFNWLTGRVRRGPDRLYLPSYEPIQLF